MIYADRNDLVTPAPAVLAALRALPEDVLSTYPRGHSELIARIADRLGVDRGRIGLGQGAEELLTRAFEILSPGDAALIPTASWHHYLTLADRVGAHVVRYPIVEDPTEYHVDVDALLERCATPGLRLVLLASPNNPTGSPFPRHRLHELLTHVQVVAPRAVVVLDEAYHGLAEHDEDDVAELIDRHSNLIVLRTFSKLYGLAGLRVGYAVVGTDPGPTAVLRATECLLGRNRVAEQLALTALGPESAEHYAMVRKTMADDRETFYRALRSYPGVRAYRSEANFVLVRLPDHAVPRVRTALLTAGFQVKFQAEHEFTNCARISLGPPEVNTALLAVLVHELAEVLVAA